MSLRKHYLRTEKYLRRHGLKSALKRSWREIQNRFFHNREVLYCQRLVPQKDEGPSVPEGFQIERYDRRTDVPDRCLRRIAEHYSEELMKEHLRRRFDLGAHLWWLACGQEDIGYTEEMGRTMIANIVMLGFFASVAKAISRKAAEDAVTVTVPKGTVELNLKAFARGWDDGAATLKSRDKKAAEHAGASV